MRNRTIGALAVVGALLAGPGWACEAERFGAGVELDATTPVSAILERAIELEGRPVAVEGTVREVCRMAGCWLEIEAADSGETLRVKVKDGEIVFPLWARGHAARAQGTVERSHTAQIDQLRFPQTDTVFLISERNRARSSTRTRSRARVRSTSSA